MQTHCLILFVAFLYQICLFAFAPFNTSHYHIYARNHSLTLLTTDYIHHCLLYVQYITSVIKYIFVIPYLHVVSLFVTGYELVRDNPIYKNMMVHCSMLSFHS